VTANLAFSFSQLTERVLVIDADLRHGNLHTIFDVPNSKGLTSVLHGKGPVEDAIEHSPLATVDVLTRGPNVNHPAELLAQPEFEFLLESLRHQYDVVLLDTPPLLDATEASILAPKVDGVLVSLMIDHSSVPEAQHARDLLDTLRAKVLGIVINHVPPGRQNGRYHDTRSNVTQTDSGQVETAAASRADLHQ